MLNSSYFITNDSFVPTFYLSQLIIGGKPELEAERAITFDFGLTNQFSIIYRDVVVLLRATRCQSALSFCVFIFIFTITSRI